MLQDSQFHSQYEEMSMRRARLLWVLAQFSFLLTFFIVPACAETIELVTYYPAPSTPDQHLRSLTVGTPYATVTPNDGQAFIYDSVGIGTTSPLGPLHVAGFNDQLSSVIFEPGQDTGVAGTPDLRVGIGPGFTVVSPPTQRLEVKGNVYANGGSAGTALFMANRSDNVNFYNGLQLLTAGAVKWTIGSRPGGTEDLRIFSDADNAVRLSIQQGSGNVGIGTTAPTGYLHVAGPDNAASNVLFMPGAGTGTLKVGIGTTNPQGDLHLAIPGTAANPNADFLVERTGANPSLVQLVAAPDLGVVGTASNDPLAIATNNQTRMTISAAGNVGIGVSNPSMTLELPAYGNIRIGSSYYGGDSTYTHIGHNGYWSGASGWFFPDTSQWSSLLQLVNGYMIFYNRPPNTMAPSSGGWYQRFYVSPDGGVYHHGLVDLSDRRLKRAIFPFTNALERICQLQGVNFRWKDPTLGSSIQLGLVAQEVEKIFPGAVRSDRRGLKGVDYNQLTAVLVEAVKELKAKNEKLEERLRAVEKATADHR